MKIKPLDISVIIQGSISEYTTKPKSKTTTKIILENFRSGPRKPKKTK